MSDAFKAITVTPGRGEELSSSTVPVTVVLVCAKTAIENNKSNAVLKDLIILILAILVLFLEILANRIKSARLQGCY